MELPFFTTSVATSSSGGSATTRAEALRWLAIAEKLLAGRDLVGSKSFAARARESDPTLIYADQIIAVADTLLAGDKRINNLPDWYSVLQLTPHQSRDAELIAGQYRKLALLLNPQKNSLPFADQAFTLVVSAWQVLSNPSSKNMYDNELVAHLRVNQVSLGFNPVSSGVSREQVNYQPFEINFQVMPQPQHQHQPQYGMFREPQPPPPSQILPQQQNLSREPMTQFFPQQNLSREQVRQPQPQPQPQPPPQPQPHPQPQPPPQPQSQPQQLRKETFMGSNVTHNFSSNVGNIGTTSNNNNNVEDDDDEENDDDGDGDVNVREEARRGDRTSEDGELSFWTACPYCYYMYEYPNVYVECTLKCQNCRSAFQGVAIPSPPPIVDGQDAYFCCWGLMPLGVSMGVLERHREKGAIWTPFSPMFNCPSGMGNNGNVGNWDNFGGWNVNDGNNNAAGPRSGNVGFRKRGSGPRVYVDNEDVFLEYSDPSEESDDADWRNETKKKKTKVVKKKGTGTPGRRGRPPKVDKGKNLEGGSSENVQEGLVVQEGVGVVNASPVDSSKKGAATNARRHSARVAKDFGKLDLNVEFNNEVEEPARRVIQGNGAGRGEEDIIEGGGFFEGLDEFLSTLPILNVVGDDKVKVA
ncbi:hypothetical protein ACH5RR_022392 [Cinchona calisaya]|uniref:J domain-containing protein n=1 Tax=Cinchona calisaya TaxID=153742 RepID=A0ABD2ZB26_9GENT